MVSRETIHWPVDWAVVDHKGHKDEFGCYGDISDITVSVSVGCSRFATIRQSALKRGRGLGCLVDWQMPS